MPPKKPQQQESQKKNAALVERLRLESEERERTVAFVMCHPYACTMSPINGELPPCLFPLCGSPVLLYVLNWLSVNSVDKIYLLCRPNDKKQIQRVTSLCTARMMMNNITIVETRDEITSVGDCMRVIDKWNQQNNGFKHCIVVPGTLVTNVKLKEIVDQHISTFVDQKINKAAKIDHGELVATCVFTQGKYNTYNIIEGEDQSILQIKPTAEFEFNEGPLSLSIDPKLFKKTSRLLLRTGLHDSQIYICAGQMFPDFGENFDWRTFCGDCIPTQIKNKELINHVIHMRYCKDSFAQTIDDLPDYLNTSLAMIRRWLYPVTVEMNFFPPTECHSALNDDFPMEEEEEQSNSFSSDNLSKLIADDSKKDDDSTAFMLYRDLVYRYNYVFPSLTSKVSHSVINNNSKVEDGAIIKNSVIGANCTIGKNAVIENCVIWDRCVIGANTKIDHSLIASDCTIADGRTIEFGCIIGFNCTINCDIPRCRRLTRLQELKPDGLFQTGDEDFMQPDIPRWLADYCDSKFDQPIELPEQDDEVFEFFATPTHEIPLLRMWLDLKHDDFPIEQTHIINGGDDDEMMEEEDFFDQPYEGDEQDEGDENDECPISISEEFLERAIELIKSALDKDGSIENVGTELNSLKLKEKAQDLACGIAILLMIIKYNRDNILDQIEEMGDLFYKFIESDENQADLLYWWQWYCSQDYDDRKDMFIKVLNKLIENDVVEETALEDWKEGQEDSTATQKKLYEAYAETIDKE